MIRELVSIEMIRELVNMFGELFPALVIIMLLISCFFFLVTMRKTGELYAMMKLILLSLQEAGLIDLNWKDKNGKQLIVPGKNMTVIINDSLHLSAEILPPEVSGTNGENKVEG